MNGQTERDNRALIDWWSRAFASSPEDSSAEQGETEDWRDLAPSEKLFRAAASLGRRKRVLDYGCGSAWAAVIAAKSGCPEVVAADPAPGAAKAAGRAAVLYGTAEQVQVCCIPPDWLRTVPAERYDGFFCSNVLDVVPPETAEEIIRESSRIVTRDADVIIGMNYVLTPETAAAKGLTLQDGKLYLDGVLRLMSRTDEEWEEIFSPYYTVERLEHFAWPGETTETRRLFWLKKRKDR